MDKDTVIPALMLGVGAVVTVGIAVVGAVVTRPEPPQASPTTTPSPVSKKFHEVVEANPASIGKKHDHAFTYVKNACVAPNTIAEFGDLKGYPASGAALLAVERLNVEVSAIRLSPDKGYTLVQPVTVYFKDGSTMTFSYLPNGLPIRDDEQWKRTDFDWCRTVDQMK